MYKDFIAGWAAGGAGLVIGHPLDTVKARLQTMKGYGGITDCLWKTIREESVRGLYKGLWIPFLSTGALHSLLFAGYGAALKMMHPGESNVEARKDLPMREILLASICGTLCQVGPAIPVELIKTKLQVQKENVTSNSRGALYSGPWDCARKIVRTEGLCGLFKGGSIFFVRDNIGYLFYIPVYEGTLRLLRTRNVAETPAQLFAGGCAGVIGWFSICPLEVIKNQIQTNKSPHKLKATTVAKQLWNEAGIKAFYRGGLTISVRGFIVNAAIFLVYENAIRVLDG